MSDNINKNHPAWEEMSKKWDLIDALCGGTAKMRQAGTAYLPQEPKETNRAYRVRKERSFLYPGLSTTLKNLASKPFARDVQVDTENEFMKQIVENIDLTGRNLTQFSADVFKDAFKHGLSHMLVEMPERIEGQTPESIAGQYESNFRPYLCHVKARQLVNWTTETVNGVTALSSISIRHSVWVNKNFGQVAEEQLRIITRKEVLTYRINGKKTPELIGKKEHTFGFVPLVTVYTERTGLLKANPPLDSLAWTNLAHWQSSSDQRNILRIARVPFLLATGFSDTAHIDPMTGEPGGSEIDNLTNIGPNSLVYSTKADADVKWIEHQGNGIEAGERDLASLKEDMFMQGAQFLMPKDTKQTATEYQGTSENSLSELQMAVSNMKDGLETAFKYIAEFGNLGEAPSIDVFNDFAISQQDAREIDTLYNARKSGMITHRTFLIEMKRRGVLDDGVDIESELEETSDEDVILSSIAGAGNLNG